MDNDSDEITGARTSAQAPPALIKALTSLLSPLVRLLLHFQITYPYFSQLLKTVYVEVAEREFRLEDQPQTDSRISMLTGIHRKEVKRLREDVETNTAMPDNISFGSQMVATWLSDARFSHQGVPHALPRLSKSGEVGFDTLVSLVSKQDLRTKVVLEEWMRLGLVQVDEDDLVHLVVEAFIPAAGFDEKAYFFGKNLRDHIAAGAHNLQGGKPPQFDRSVFYNNLTPASIAQLSRLIEQRSMDILKAVNSEAKALQNMDRGKPEASRRINFGAYLWVEQQQLERQQAEPQETKHEDR